MKWTEFLAELRADLKDTGTGVSPAPTIFKWSDKVLFLYAKDAIRDYSTWFPKRKDRVAILPTGESYALPVDYIREISVELPIDTYLQLRQSKPGTQYKIQPKVSFYFIQSGQVYINCKAGDRPIYLTYAAAHTVPTSETDATTELTIPDIDLELIRTYVKAKVYGQMKSNQASLDRFKATGARDDNPIEAEVVDFMAEYRRGIADRTPVSMVTLYTTGRSK